MEHTAETNGCEDGPAALSVSNHADSAQVKTSEKQSIKSSHQESRSSRHISGNTPRRIKRHSPVTTVTTVTSTAQERRSTRKSPSSPVRPAAPVSIGDRRPVKNSLSIPATHNQINKRSSLTHPPPRTTPVMNQPVTVSVTVASPEGSSTVKHVKHSTNSSVQPFPSPSVVQKKRRQKRVLTIEPEPSTSRSSKRIRLQYQPFQSPPPPTIIPAILRQNISRTPEDKIVVFHKGEFLAVRNENGSFFVCRTAQNVYKSSKRFKIQWMNDKEPDLYTPDFYDHTDFECVLTNLRLKRVDKNKHLLPNEERKRTLNILQRALNVENGMDIPDPHQVTTDGVDVSIVGKEEEEEVLRLQHHIPRTDLRSRAAYLRGRGRPRKNDSLLQKFRKNLRSSDSSLSKPKIISTKVKLQNRETVKVKLKAKQGSRMLVSTTSGIAQNQAIKKRKIIERLHPNSKVTLFEKDPTFESNLQIPYVSSSAHSKLLIRAVLLKDSKMLQSLLEDTQRICSLDAARSVDIPYTALTYAVLKEDHRAIRALMSIPKRKYCSPPENLLEYQETGSFNVTMLGHALKQVNLSRGGREGNNAFLKDASLYPAAYPCSGPKLIKEALCKGVSMDTLNLLCSQDNTTKASHFSYEKDGVYLKIVASIKSGHNKLAGHLVDEAIQKGGYGFGALHKEVLLNDRQPLSKFRPVSVTKKATENSKVTPLHCACINPNPQYLAALLAVAPEYNLPDKDGWRLIHYAAVCKSTGPLELLLSRGVSPDEVDLEGNCPLHIACIAGRAHNVDLLLRHSSLSEQNKKENNPVLLSEKSGMGGVDCINKKSFTPLHLASQYGHADVVRVLLRHKANVDKQTSAAHDKLTPLMLATKQGHLSIIKILVENTALVEAKDKKQRTALTHAVINGHAHIASYLLRLGANPNTSDSSGNTLVHYAAAYGWYFCLKVLIEAGASLNLPNDWKVTPLSLAFMKGHMGLVDYLVEQPGIDINVDVHNESGMTLIMQALRTKINQSMLERIHFLVVKQKSDCTKVDFMGNNALHHLVLAEVDEMNKEQKKTREESVEGTNTEHVADEDDEEDGQKNKEEKEDLFKEEAQQEHDALIQEITKLLLDYGCNPEVKNKEGESSFTLAVKEGCLLLVKMFLDAGCRLTVDTSQMGDTILHYLVGHACLRKVEPMLHAILNAKCGDTDSNSHQLLCQMAKLYNKNGHTPLLQALDTLRSCSDEESKIRLLSFVKFLIDELGADVSAPLKDSKGQDVTTALHLATECSGRRATEVLLSHKAPLNTLDVNGRTALILAIKNGNIEAADALIRAGAAVSIKSPKDDNLSPLILAARNINLGKVVQLLVHHKADVNDIDPTNKNTALHYVVSNRAADVVETVKSLVSAGASINALNDRQRTPLHLTVNSSECGSDASYALEEYLLNSGIKTDARDCLGRIPLHYAFVKINQHTQTSQIDPIELVVLLTASMGNTPIDVADNFSQTPLHRAAYRGATISTMHLAQRTKNLDVKDKNGNTPFGLAVKNGHESCALMLLQRGASCIVDLTNVQEDRNKKKNVCWQWLHVQTPSPPITKHPILQEALLKNWQGILYLMLDQLEAMGKGITLAIEAALRTAKYNVALKLIGRVKHGWTLYSEKQSMLHLLAREAPATSLGDLQVKVAQALIEKGVPVMARDEHGCSVLTYAALNWNYTLCSFFCGKIGMVAAAQADPDKSLRTPFSALFWKLTNKGFSQDIWDWCLSLLKSGASPNILTRYPIQDSSFPGVRCTTIDSLHTEDNSAPKLSPLMVAIYKQNYVVAKLLLENGANVNFADDLQKTPLMLAARLNDIRMVKLLLNNSYDPLKDKNPAAETEQGTFQKTSAVEMTKKDIHGWTVVHHLVSPLHDYSYNNTALLYLLAEMGAPLDRTNSAGETPLQMAVRNRREATVIALQELLNIPEDKRDKPIPPSLPSVNDGIQWDLPSWDYKEDSKLMVKKLEEELMDTSGDKCEFPPDVFSGLQTVGKVLLDSEQNIPYDALLTAVDLNYGSYGIYNFYKMQLLIHTSKDLVVLFTRWGRVGDTGQYQKTPFNSLQDGIKEFSKIFRSKTSNSWEDLKNFQPQPKKYNLVQLEKRHSLMKQNIKLTLASELPSKLPKPLEKTIKHLMDVHMLHGSLHDMGVGYSWQDIAPLGQLSEIALVQASELLKEIGNLIKEKDTLQQNMKSVEQYAELLHKIVKLSEEFYQLVPVYGYEYERLPPLFSELELHEKMVLIHNLLHIELAGEMLLGAHLKSSEVNPADYIYRSLGCKLQLLDRGSQEAQMILQFIYNTAIHNKPSVEAIFRVFREEEWDRLKECNLQQHFLLWHGTRSANMLSILSRGLQVAPLGVQTSGNLFGKGIYFADMFSKSQKYCVAHFKDHNTRFILLCEVALGNLKVTNSAVENEECDSIKVPGHWQPDPSQCVSWQGLAVPLGTPVKDLEEQGVSNCSSCFLQFNEYVVYKPSQVCLRYLVQFRE